MTQNPDGSVTIEETLGTLKQFKPRNDPQLSTDFIEFPVFAPNNSLIVDFDQDGKQDIITIEGGTGKLVLQHNKGGRQFAIPSRITAGNPGALRTFTPLVNDLTPDLTDIEAGDFNGDGIVDLVVGRQRRSAGLGFLYGLGNGRFAAPVDQVVGRTGGSNVLALATGDYNADGLTDLAVAVDSLNSFVTLLVAQPGGGFNTVATGISGFNIFSIASGDINGDGIADVAALAGGSNKLMVSFGSPAGLSAPISISFSGAGTDGTFILRKVSVGDIDGDGRAEISVAGKADGFVVTAVRSQGSGATPVFALKLAYKFSFGVNGQIASTRIADITGDGKKEVLFVDASNKMWVYAPQSQDPNDVLRSFIVPSIRSNDILVADFDQDGVPDIEVLYRAAVDGADGAVKLHWGSLTGGKFTAPAGDFSGLTRNADGSYTRKYKDGSIVSFNAQGFQTSFADRNGNTTLYEYDANGAVIKVTDPAGLVTLFTYVNGRLASTTDPAGRVTRMDYGPDGQLIKTTQPDATTLSYAYDNFGRMTAKTDERGFTTSYSYGAAGRLQSTVVPDGATIAMTIGAQLGIADLSAGNNGTLAYVRPSERVTRLVDPLGRKLAVEVNKFGGAVRILDPIGRLTRYERDANNLIRRIAAISS